MKFIELHYKDSGDPILVNVDAVALIRGANDDNNTVIYWADDTELLLVEEGYDVVRAKLQAFG